MDQSMQDMGKQILSLVTEYGLNVVGAIIILIVGWMAAGWAQRAVRRGLAKTERCDETLQGFFGSLARYFVLVFTVLAVLSQFGIQTASLIAVFGAAGLAIGLALQGTLSNIAAGVMLLTFRPFKVGDYVDVAGLAGTVKSISLFVTELATPDNVQILAPNGQIWGAAVKNFSHHSTRRMDLPIGIDYKADLDSAMKILLAEAANDARVLRDPEPTAFVGELGDSAVTITTRIWCAASDYWNVKFDLTRKLKERLDREGIGIPFPQRTVHLMQKAS